MPADDTIRVSPIAQWTYGFTDVSRSSIANYGKALLAISGADGEVSPPERQWFRTNFVETLMLPGDLAEMFDGYDFSGADIDRLVEGIVLATPGDYRMMVVYDAIRMARADEKFAVEERALAGRGATALGVDKDRFRVLESMVLLEESNANLRKALFRLDPDAAPDLMAADAHRLKLNPWVTEHFGYTFSTRAAMSGLGRLLLAIAGADAAVSAAEMDWLEALTRAAGVPDDIRAGFRDYDYAGADIAALGRSFVVDRAMDTETVVVYLAIQMAGADGAYAEAEKAAVRRAAPGLGVDTDTIHHLEQLVLVERHVEKLRKSLFGVV